jgi:predicted dehydrogenase
MSDKRIKWGILGTSPISEVMAKAIQASHSGQLLAIGSRSLLKAKNFSETYSVPNYYDDYDALMNDDEIDAIYIGLPNHFHKEWILRSAKAGKHILCEKPFVLNTNEAREVIDLVEKSNVFCMEALMYRCHPFTKKLQELVQNKMIGDIKLYNATYTANIADIANPTAGGGIRNLGCYPISLIRLLAKAEPIEIRAMGRRSPETQNDNQASAILKFENGSMAVVSTADDITMCWQFDIYGTEGSIKVITNPWLPDCNSNKILLYKNGEDNPQEINVTADKSLYTYQIDTVGECILSGEFTKHGGISLADSYGNVAVLEQWLQQVDIEGLHA